MHKQGVSSRDFNVARQFVEWVAKITKNAVAIFFPLVSKLKWSNMFMIKDVLGYTVELQWLEH